MSPLDCLHQLFPGSLGAEGLEAMPSPQGLGATDQHPSMAAKRELSLDNAQLGHQGCKPAGADTHPLSCLSHFEINPWTRLAVGGTLWHGRGPASDPGAHGPSHRAETQGAL